MQVCIVERSSSTVQLIVKQLATIVQQGLERGKDLILEWIC